MIKFKLDVGAKLPARGKAGDAGMDICAIECGTLLPKARLLVKTGVHLADCSSDLYLRVAPRSKLANQYGIDALAGVVDSNYRGQVCVILHNTGDHVFNWDEGDAIAQLIPTLIAKEPAIEVTEVTESARGDTGIQDDDLRTQQKVTVGTYKLVNPEGYFGYAGANQSIFRDCAKDDYVYIDEVDVDGAGWVGECLVMDTEELRFFEKVSDKELQAE